jgi:hypothetical protein
MLRQGARCLVGLITIETLPLDQCPAEPAGRRDSTLAEFLAYLARPDASNVQLGADEGSDKAFSRGAGMRVSHERLVPLAVGRLARKRRVLADVKRLAVELERALVGARFKLAASR